MKGQMEAQTSQESTADRVLRIPDELLAHIFGYLAAESDREALATVRLVCSPWKQEAFVALKTNPSLFLSVNCSGSLKRFTESVMPGCGLPIKLTNIEEWTPELESLIRDFSAEIVHMELSGDFRGFPEDLKGIELPAMTYATFSADYICRDEDEKLVEFPKAVKFWNELVRLSKNLKTWKITLGIYDDLLRPDHAAFEQTKWSQVGDLQCSCEFFADVCASNELSALHRLECYSSVFVDVRDDDEDMMKQISLKKVPDLTNVHLGDQVEWILDHQMKKLETLTLVGTRISGGLSPSQLFPNLKSITVSEASMESSPFDWLISDGEVFTNVVELDLSESRVNLNERIGDVAIQLCESFPSLTNLNWNCSNDTFQDVEEDNNNALYAAPIIFSRLEFLVCLDLMVVSPSERELVELVTGICLDNIPEEEDSWSTSLVNNPHSIRNLKHLREFYLELHAGPVSVSPRHTRFLFAAAFRTMDTLEMLYFSRYVTFEDTSCATEWEEMGRRISFGFDYNHDGIFE